MRIFGLYVLLLCMVTGNMWAGSAIGKRYAAKQAFIENNGQLTDEYGNMRPDIDFRLRGGGVNVFIGNGAIQYQWGKTSREQGNAMEFYRMDAVLLNANPHAEIIKEEQQAYYERYYLGHCPQGITANTFQKIIYKDIYPNIDWVLYIEEGKSKKSKIKSDDVNVLKYDFVIHEGGNVNDIKIRYSGAESVTLTDKGITAFNAFGHISEGAPYTYDLKTGKEIKSSYKLNGEVLSFEMEAYDGEIVIDPAINWGTYFGGAGNEIANEVKTDAAGNVYVVGTTASDGLAINAKGQLLRGGGQDGFLFKLNADGTAAWANYFGGDKDDYLTALALDASCNVYIAGTTESTGLACCGAYQLSKSTGEDAVIAKFDSSGLRKWATYYGGTGDDSCISIAVLDDSDALFIGGKMASPLMATVGNGLSSDGEDAFLARFNINNGQRAWSRYHVAYIISGIACDTHNVYVTGYSLTSDGVAFGDVFQKVYGGNGAADGFFAKYKLSGELLWSSYYGGDKVDFSNAIAIDADGYIYIAGEAESANSESIATAGSYRHIHNGTYDAFVAKFTNDGKTRLWGTYYGGGFEDGAFGITLDASGNIYITGETVSMTGISTSISHQHNLGGGYDAFIAQFSNDGTKLKWGTYYGGDKPEKGKSIAYDTINKALYICGNTQSNNAIATDDGFQTFYTPPDGDAFIASFTADSPYVVIDMPFNDTVFCAGDSFDVSYTAVEMQLGNIIEVQLSQANGSFPNIIIGSDTSLASGIIKCGIPESIIPGTGYRIRVTSSNPPLISPDNGTDIRIDKFPTNPVAASNSPLCEGDTLQFDINNVPPNGMAIQWSGPGVINPGIKNPSIDSVKLADSGDYYLKMNYGACELKDTVHVSVTPNPPEIAVSSNTPVCEKGTIQLMTGDSVTARKYSISWTGPGGFKDTSVAPAITDAAMQHAGVYTMQLKTGICTSETNTDVVIQPAPQVPVITVNSPVIAGKELQLSASSGTPGVSYAWTGPDSFSSVQQNVVIKPVSPKAGGRYTVAVTLGNCVSSASVLVDVLGDLLGLYPNPNNGTFIISGSVNNEQAIPMRVVNMSGVVFYETRVQTEKKLVNTTITLPLYLPNADYILEMYVDNGYRYFPFVILR